MYEELHIAIGATQSHREVFAAHPGEGVHGGFLQVPKTEGLPLLARLGPETQWGINSDGLAFYMPLIKKVAEAKGTGLIDLFTTLSNQKALFPDNIHPNAAGARKMA